MWEMQKSAIKSWTLMWQQQQNGHAQREKHFGQKYMHVFQNKYVTWPKQYTLLSIVPSISASPLSPYSHANARLWKIISLSNFTCLNQNLAASQGTPLNSF